MKWQMNEWMNEWIKKQWRGKYKRKNQCDVTDKCITEKAEKKKQEWKDAWKPEYGENKKN